MAEKSKTPKADVNSMFQKMGEKLGWFDYKDLDCAMKTLSEKKKHSKSRLKIINKCGKENRPASNLKVVDGQSSSHKSPLQEIQTDSGFERREIPLRKSPASTDLTRNINEGNIYNTSIISPYPDGEVFSVLEDVGLPLVESTRIHSRQSFDINEETGENDSYENLRIKKTKSEQKRISDLYVTAVESQNDYYSVIDIATQTVRNSASDDNEPQTSENDSQTSECSLYEVKDMGIQTESNNDSNINQSSDSLCNDFSKSLSLAESKINSEESDLVLRLDTQDSFPESSLTIKNKDGLGEKTSVTEFEKVVKRTPKSLTLKNKIMKNKITFSDSDSDDDFNPPFKTPSSTGRKKHSLYTPSGESFLFPASTNSNKKTLAKIKALLSSDSENDLPVPEVTKTKSKYFTPKSTVKDKFEVSYDSLPDLNLERYRVQVEEHSSNWRSAKRIVSDSSEDDDLEKFLESVKTPVKTPVKTTAVNTKSMKAFIVDDDVIISSESESDEEIFYISTQSPNNRGCTILKSPVSRKTTPSVVDINLPLSQRIKTPSTLSRPSSLTTPNKGISDVFKTPQQPKRSAVRCLSDKSTLKPTDSKPYTFLRSLSTELPDYKRHPDVIKYIKQFKKYHQELSSKLFKLFNYTIFDSKLPDDMDITWNKRLLRTAGYCAYKRVNGKHVARVELSTKVCDTAERVRDTLIHELCHAAVWMLNQRTDGHGPYWKYWSRKSNVSHPELPVISRCHNYSITTKFTYVCTQCGYKIGRHSKSLDTERKVCGHCHGRFELAETPGSRKGTPKTPRTPNKFALFVKDNYGSAKKGNSDLKHKDIMRLLSHLFAEKTKLNST